MNLGQTVVVTTSTQKKVNGKWEEIEIKKVGILSAIDQETFSVHIFNNSEVKPLIYTKVSKDQVAPVEVEESEEE